MKRKGALWELILFFERHRIENIENIWKKVEKLNLCSKATFYRYHQRWLESDNKLKVIEKELWK